MNCCNIISSINWNAVAAIGTVLAAFVGIVGIWINYHEKTKKLAIFVSEVPPFEILINNNSTRNVQIVKMNCFIEQHCFYGGYYTGLSELYIKPLSNKHIRLDEKALVKSYKKYGMPALCSSSSTISIELVDNHKRKYKVKTSISIAMLEESINTKNEKNNKNNH